MKIFLALILTILSACAIAVQGSAGPYRIDLRTDPSVVPVGRAKLIIVLTDSSGKPVTQATVKVLAQMPGMPMGEREETATPEGTPGTFTAPASFGMGGAYDTKITVDGPAGIGQTTLNLSTGESTGSGSGAGISFITILPWGLAVLALILILIRVRRSGQSVDWRSILNRQVAISILLLGAALLIAVWAINKFRRPGSMTPMEAQGMQMSVPAPQGALPVRLAKVELKPFSSTVTYTGQVVGFVEQDVVSRASGAITWMPFYVGNKVARGQVLARLDTTQIDPMVSEKMAGVDNASQGVGVATMEFEQAVNMVAQARAEVSMAEGEVAESKSMLDAVQQGRGSAVSQVASSQSDVASMKAGLRSAQADLNYQEQELARMKTLFDKGAISKDEWQRSVADAQKSRAAVDKAKEDVVKAQAGVAASGYELKKTDAEITAARRKVQQAESQLLAKKAAVATAQAAASAAKAKIGQSRSGVAEASAGLRGATTQRGYSELRSEVDGVITARVMNPGVVVSPGQTVLKLAQVSPIRLQANVPEDDLARLQLGASVKVTRRGGNEAPLDVKVTSISPSVDPASRTGIVEAVYANSSSHFMPGQYISMEITVGADARSKVIPAEAVEMEEDHAYVWVAVSGTNGEYSVSRREIKIRGKAAGSVAVESGIDEGQQVIVSPPQGLTESAKVTVVATNVAMVVPEGQHQTIEATTEGFTPASVTIPSGQAVTLSFVRRDEDKSCATEVIFPSLSIRKALPLNQPISIDIPAQKTGSELKFTCPTNMFGGKVVAR